MRRGTDELEPLITKPVQEEISPGVSRLSWPTPWLTGEHLHKLWRENVLSDDIDRKRAAADLYVNEYNFRWIRASDILVRTYGGSSVEKINAGLKTLEDHEVRLLIRYKEAFGAPCIFGSDLKLSIGPPDPTSLGFVSASQNSPNRPPEMIPPEQMRIDMNLDQEQPLPKRSQEWRDRSAQDFKGA